ncbi:GNAT family N-acetyltransferase [Pseudoduganella violaceinigra]|uniref:GNAT family N-acetyltransferase n=1 Tax=Pseudoduganella violaceinigra TaxID=246602 RepID=UPI000420E78C|nr:GNAT family N-acetyltransferase [Pseudoduganella violaceinigra]
MTFTIRPLRAEELAAFFDYLNDHLRDNGRGGTPLFQPMSRSSAGFPPEKVNGFSTGLHAGFGQQGWRRVWVALTGEQIIGHIDLRSRPDPASRHRCLLGMGVHRDARRGGLGSALVGTASAWAREQGLEWLDLEVLEGNAPARSLYHKCGFVQTGMIPDLFRIDGERLGYVFMSLQLAAGADRMDV